MLIRARLLIDPRIFTKMLNNSDFVCLKNKCINLEIKHGVSVN